jgi:hypothetical protein
MRELVPLAALDSLFVYPCLYTGKGYSLSVENIHKHMWVCVIGLLCRGGEAKAQNVRPMRLLLEWKP